ncbi:hypothetical protein FSARC_10502 [Fusarium sarcochroum]|uniref:Protein kinase domain-containing protein n=1 Tax=Fusarium sarcochroum TaxID=1208366 RepID=A0A8H4X3Q2_9HYPO|nr:hypothetical protein FSARC_10502 [Fusarium sarcochroum]
MADFQSFSTYSVAPTETELINRPDQTYAVKGQAEFLAVAVALEVPILSAQNNAIASMNIFSAGAGASFSVFASAEELSLDEDEDFLNPTPGVRSWIAEAQESQRFQRYVTKRIVTSQGVADDSRQLASVINEIRILSTERIRNCDHIVSMLAISWSESPSVGRFWPQVLLEAADEGSLADYLSSNQLNFKSQLAIGMGIGRALEFLHAHRVVHADIKPANVLVFTSGFDEEQHDVMDRTGIVPIRAKLCDFGYAVILDDYKSQEFFQARIGSFPWMAPELDAGEAMPLEDLHKADIYSFGLLTASIFMNGCTPFDCMTPEEISVVKTRPLDHVFSAVTALMHSIEHISSPNEYQKDFIQTLLMGTCAPSSSGRVSLAAIQSFLFLGLVQQLDRGQPAIPMEWFPDLRDADGYMGALIAFQRKHSGVGDLFDDPDVPDVLLRLREMRDSVISIQIGNPEFEEQLGNYFEDHTPEPGSLRRFRNTWRSDDTFEESEDFINRMDEIFDQAIVKVPPLAFEHSLSANLFPRVAREEVIRDLQDTCDSNYIREPAAPFHLAGAYFNGTIVEPSTDMGLKHLVKAAMLKNPEAVSLILNIFDACDTSLPEDEKDQLLDIVKDYGSKALGQAQETLFDHLIPRHIEHHTVLAETWARKWPDKYSQYLTTYRKAANIVLPLLNSPLYLKAEPVTGHPEFDSDQLTLINARSLDKFDITKTQELKNEIARLGCLNSCNDDGFTILQIAAIKDDLELARILVSELGASVNTYGNTHGWTPLLLSCHCGHFEMAKFLVDNSADPTIKETLHRATILHSLNRFTERQHCEQILKIALSAGININSRLKSGATPLHTTFSGWDYSRGAAAELLLEYGADPAKEANEWDGALNFVSPITYAAENLDVDLLQKMVSASQSLISNNGLSVQQLSKVKAQALGALFRRTQFYCMSVGGSGYQKKLETIISLLIDDQVRAFLIARRENPDQPTDPFLAMCSQGNVCFMEAFLNIFPQTVVDNPAWELPRTFLHLAIERRNVGMVRLLIRYGADLLTKDVLGRTSLQVAAHYFPQMVPEFIQILEDLSLEKRQGKSVSDILEHRDNSGRTLFAQLLIEGYDDERQLAESLRVRYRLKHDYRMRDEEDWITFGGYMMILSATQGLIPVETIQYLLELDPPLEFTTNPEGKTLLTTAVGGFSGYQVSYDLPCHQITTLLLDRYPEYERLMQTSDAEGRCILHIAAYWSNKTALQMFKDHIDRHYPDISLPWNTLASRNSVLDLSTLGIQKMALATWGTEVNKVAMKSTKKAALACYEFLRENGALHNWEFEGTMVAARPIMYELDPVRVMVFIRMATQRMGLGEPDIDPERCVDIGDRTSFGARLIRVPVVDLIWRYDNFIIRHYCVRISSQPIQGFDQFHAWIEQRMTKDEPRCYNQLALPPGLWPFMTLKYEHRVPHTQEVVRWRRPGRIWTEEERDDLKGHFSGLWDALFGRIEQEYIARLAGENLINKGVLRESTGQPFDEEDVYNRFDAAGAILKHDGYWRCLTA